MNFNKQLLVSYMLTKDSTTLVTFSSLTVTLNHSFETGADFSEALNQLIRDEMSVPENQRVIILSVSDISQFIF